MHATIFYVCRINKDLGREAEKNRNMCIKIVKYKSAYAFQIYFIVVIIVQNNAQIKI